MRRSRAAIRVAAAVLVLAGAPELCRVAATPAGAQGEGPDTEFGRLAARLAQQRLGGGEENEKLQEQALAILDGIVLVALNTSGEPNLEALNQRLAALVTQQPPIGEGYRVLRLAGDARAFALAANFGLGGPSAVRLYRGVAGRYAQAARIDHFVQKDFFDEYLELIPIQATATLFITVTGRTDELQTGSFMLWRFDGDRVKAVWASDLLPRSSYEYRADGFRLTYCAETDEDDPRVCHRMTRDRYIWDGAAWKRVEQTPLPVPKR